MESTGQAEHFGHRLGGGAEGDACPTIEEMIDACAGYGVSGLEVLMQHLERNGATSLPRLRELDWHEATTVAGLQRERVYDRAEHRHVVCRRALNPELVGRCEHPRLVDACRQRQLDEQPVWVAEGEDALGAA